MPKRPDAAGLPAAGCGPSERTAPFELRSSRRAARNGRRRPAFSFAPAGEEISMGAITRQLYSAALAAAATYFLDAQQGRRRRAILKDKLTHLARKAERAAGITLRDSENRLHGLVSRARVHAFETAP